MGARSRTKGAIGEREIVRLARAAGLDAERTWQTAQSPDVTVRACDVRIAGLPVQVKITANGFGSLYGALEGVELLFVRADRHEWLAVVRAQELLRLLNHGDASAT